ncbi:MAG: hypothetical protein LBK62_03255 [Treponema sp.]|jgi:hypothetical protein|nr:hypothetical protein [Treponema sp.]
MKKTLFAISVALLTAGVLMLAGCEQPAFTSEPTTPIKAPALSAEVLPGAVLLSWDPVADVQEYKLYRKAGADSLPVLLQDEITYAGYYVDKVGFNNSLKDGVAYTYTLEAVARGYAPLTGAISDPKTVTATIPARTPTIVTAPAADAVTLTPYVNAGIGASNPDMLEVYWATEKANLPLRYVVEYIYGDGQTLPLVYGDTSSGSSLTGDIYAKRAVFPLVGGASTIKITARWDGSNYYAPASVTKAHTGAPTVLPVVGSISGSGSPAANGNLTLYWTAITGATGYDVYRAEITSGGPSSSGNTYASNLEGATIGAYSLIAPNAGDTRQNGNDVYFTDAGYDSAKKWLYLVIAKNAGARSSGPALYARVPSTPSVSDVNNFTVSTFQDTAADDDAWKVSVSWDRVEGVAYTLYRAPAEFDQSDSMVSVGEYTAIPAASLSEKDGKVIYIDTVGTGQLSLWQSYRYKVVGTKDGASTQSTRNLTTLPFGKFFSGSPNVSASGVSYGQLKVRPSEPPYSTGLTYELYAAESDGTQLTSGWTEITLGTADDNGYYTWSAPDTRKRYVFSQTTKAGDITLGNNNPSTSTLNPYAPKLAASSSSWGISPSVLGQDTGNVVISIGSALTPPADPPASWWLKESAYQTLSGAKIYRSAEADNSTIGKTSVATVLFNATNAAITVNTASVAPWSFYIVLPKHNTIPATTAGVGTSENWYFGTEYNSGGATSFTSTNYYVIQRTSTTATTVSSVN